MFPLRDHNPSGRRPYVTWLLIVVNVAVFISYAGMDPRALDAFFDNYALFPARVTSGEGFGGILTSMFLHGGFMHIAGNMLFLWIFGDNMEDKLGHLGFLGFYLASGVAAAVAQILADPSSGVPMVGASGAIAGVMGGYLLLFPKARVDILFIFIVFFKVFPVPAWVMLGIWFGLQFFSGLTADLTAGGVAYWAHAGGFIAGFLLTVPVFRRLGGTAFWNRTHGHPDHPPAQYQFSRSNVPTVRRRR
ncbi:rhomboid family intramembrane serine protease [Primorskyibacter flagellatus]|uniref:Rhomboid family intramembrane serine protease n=1 Tax=Primorskyibacter flagellatus TaxID=1387277 RepID=A0A917A8C9_9RHOB|nr:rhomboid family intramembrane serine protease [Primorskyibacter flagellatus]GGE30440.1 rhomboid family intramembrane serine protease [Primorskyibacter flagellatus]